MNAMANALSPISLTIPLVGVLAIVAVNLWCTRGQELAWWRRLPRPSAGLVGLVLLVVWCGLSLVASTYLELCLAVTALLACSLLALFGHEAGGRLNRLVRRPSLYVPRDVIILVLAGVLSCLALELPWNPGVMTALPTFWWIELAMVAVVLVALYLLGQRRGTLPAAGVFACMGIGVAQYFVALFKGAAIMPSDLYSLGTAAAVSRGYSYVLDGAALAGICCGIAGMTLLGFVRPMRAEHTERRGRVRAATAVSIALAVVLGFGFVGCVRNVSFQSLGVEVEYFFTLDKYREQGFLPSFVATWQDMPIKMPEDYTTEGAEQLEASYAEQAANVPSLRKQQFNELQPTVIAVMNETFSDLSIYSGIAEAGYEGPQFYKNGITDAVERGVLYVSAYGGGTCNTEFEFLTGTSMAFVGAGKYPYSQYDLSPVDNLARQFKALGYSTLAMHPNKASNWSRDDVYADMGFDEFYSIEDFKDAPTFHSGVTDRATYDKVIDLLEQDSGPQFIFDVTMQNHSGYDQENIPHDQLTDYQPEGVDETMNAELNEYLSCIEASDRDLEYLIGRLREIDRPVVLVFFGDHQPNVTTPYNDAYYPDEDAVLHAERAYQTTYFVWANYDIAANSQDNRQIDTSTNYLGALLLSSIGAPTSQYESAQLGLRESIPALNLYGYEGADGSWHALGSDNPYAGIFADEARISYLEFGSKVS